MNTDDYLGQIEQATRDIISDMRPADFPKEPINWGGMGVLDASKRISREGKSWQVLIDEVAPDAHEFQNAVSQNLAERGFPDVEVITEW